MTIYVRGENPIWFFNNLTGQVLDDTYWAFFLTNDLPYVPQNTFQDPNGISPWPNPMEFQPSGGLPNNLYFDPSLTYRIEIRQGPTQVDPLIWLIQNYVPGNGSGSSVIDNPLQTASNIITNPQFADVDFVSPFTFTQGSIGTYTVDVAPGWQLVLTGAGTTILTQGTNPGNSQLFGNPAYFLEINNSGWTTATLTQTFNNNGSIFAGGAVAIAFTAQAISSPETVTVVYAPNSSPPSSQNMFSGTINTGGFGQYYGLLPNTLNPTFESSNANSGTEANVQIQFVLPATGIVELSNIQVVGQSTPLTTGFEAPTSVEGSQGDVPNYQEQTYEEMVNGEFHVYKNSLLSEPKSTILTGWDFGLNPWQFRDPAAANVAANQYTADQTIVIQQNYVDTNTGNNIAVGRSEQQTNYGFRVTAVTALNQFGILNYIDYVTMRPLWGSTVSSMVTISLGTAHNTTGVQVKMRLIWNPSIPTPHSPEGATRTYPVASWTAGGDPVFASGFTVIEPINDPAYTLTPDVINQFAFNGFELPVNDGATTEPLILGVFLYTVGTPLNQAAAADFIVIRDVSLVQNDFALPSNPKTADQVLRECQYYYEQSYPNSTLPGASQYPGMRQVNCQLIKDVNDSLTTKSFTLTYETFKRIAVVPTFYAPITGNAGNVTLGINQPGVAFLAASADRAITDWTTYGATQSSYALQATTAGAGLTFTTNAANEGLILYHYIADCRLGIAGS